MHESDLTEEEMAGLTALKDTKSMNDCDARFLTALETCRIPFLHAVEDGKRRAITRYMVGLFEALLPRLKDAPELSDQRILTEMTLCLMLGYELGRKFRRPLTGKPKASLKEVVSKWLRERSPNRRR